MKKSRLLLIPAALLMLTACGGNPDTSTSTSGGGEGGGEGIPAVKKERPEGGWIQKVDGKKVEIDFWHQFDKTKGGAAIQSLVDGFMEVEPNVNVTVSQQEGGYDGLRKNIINGFSVNEYPDIAVAYPDHVADYIDYGKAARIDSADMMNNLDIGWPQSLRDDIITAYYEEGQNYKEPGIYSMPFAKSTEIMFYNEKVLIGLDLSSVQVKNEKGEVVVDGKKINGGNPINHDYLNSLTWEELFEKLCPAIVAYNDTLAEADKIFVSSADGKYGIVAYDSSDNLFITLSRQYGVDFTALKDGRPEILFNTPKMHEVMKNLRKAKDNHYFITQTLNGTYTNGLEKDRKCLFSIGSTAGTSHHEASIMAACTIPQAEGGVESVIQQGPSLCILDNNDVNQRKAAWLLYDYIAENENMLDWCQSANYNPYRKSALTSETWMNVLSDKDEKGNAKTGYPLLLSRVNTILEEYNDWFFTTPAFKGSSDCRKAAGGLLDECMVDDNLEANVQSLFDKAVQNCKSKI